MSLEALVSNLSGKEHFVSNYKKLLELNGKRQLPDYDSTDQSSDSLDVDWRHLIRVANLMIFSMDVENREMALRITTTCLISDSSSSGHKELAISILKQSSNFRAIELAKNRDLLPVTSEDLEYETISSKVAKSRIDLDSKILIDGNRFIRCNQFQHNLWDAFNDYQIISASAPTSAGKSFILYQLVLKILRERESTNILFLVPTRALINQVYQDIKNLVGHFDQDVDLITLPVDFMKGSANKKVFIFTQERLHIFFADSSDTFDLILVDEAHKIGDSYRGVLLQHAISKAISPRTKVVYTTPFSKNPEKFSIFHKVSSSFMALHNSEVTVNQNIFWITQKPRKPKEWDVSVPFGEVTKLNDLSLSNKPDNGIKRLSFIAAEIGRESNGNLVYVNLPKDAEQVCRLIIDYLDLPDVSDDSIADLVELCERTIHKKFTISASLKKGVAFHYGNLPQLVRKKVEELFASGKLKYLACTSTLVEGVNMSCKNIFVRGPKKGRSTPMTAEDFWNLAGRAGRWGMEFQGNVFCIDTNDISLWPDGAPRKRSEYTLKSTIEKNLNDAEALVDYIINGMPLGTPNSSEYDYLFTFMLDLYQKDGLFDQLVQLIDERSASALVDAVSSFSEALEIPSDIFIKNPGVNAYGMISIYRYFEENLSRIEELAPADPSSNDSVESFTAVFSRVNKFLSPNKEFGLGGRVYMLALLVVKWMEGQPLSLLISDRIGYEQKHNTFVSINSTVRKVLDDVERIARFVAPKYVSCYLDLLMHCAHKNNIELDCPGLEQVQVALEFGVSTQTHLSLIRLGLSRTAAISVSALIASDKLDENQAFNRLVELDLGESELPKLVREEVKEVIDSPTP